MGGVRTPWTPLPPESHLHMDAWDSAKIYLLAKNNLFSIANCSKIGGFWVVLQKLSIFTRQSENKMIKRNMVLLSTNRNQRYI